MKLPAMLHEQRRVDSVPLPAAGLRHAAIQPLAEQPAPIPAPAGMGHHLSRVPVRLQARHIVNEPGDRYEQEAEHVAAAVLRLPDPGAGAAIEAGRRSAAPSAIQSVLPTSGQPLDDTTRAYMEPRFGHDFSQVRVHVGDHASSLARGLGARAFTIGQDIVFGSGQYASQHLIAHELAHTVQQQAGGDSPVVQRDVVDDVREKLSYGFLDWAITDSEAMEALAMLGTIPAANLAADLARLGSKYVTRLLDNLPDAAKTGEVYKRLIETLGSAGVQSYVQEQLSYGLFDWAVTDAEVTRVFNTFTNLPAAAQEQFLADLNAAGRLKRLVSNSNAGHHSLYLRPWIRTLTRGALTQRQQQVLRAIVEGSKDEALDTLILAAETRFNVTVGKSKMAQRNPVSWEADPLRETYLVLDRLPEAHVGRNKELLSLGQYKQPAKGQYLTAGVYNEGLKELAINVEGDDRQGTIIHETGHAVDAEMGWSTGPEPAKPERGGWKSYGQAHKDASQDMVDDSGKGIKTDLAAAQVTDVVNEMATAMGNRSASSLIPNIRALPWFKGLKAAAKGAVLDDPALEALPVGLNKPYFEHPDGGVHLGSHNYQASYGSDWVRYRHEARSRMVSKYQFRDPGEWFAEAYEAYYAPDDRGRGARLADKDPSTKTYFDTAVHTRAPTR